MIDHKNRNNVYEYLVKIKGVFEGNILYKTHFTNKYRCDCLQQQIRKIFFNTLLIAENIYTHGKQNIFIVISNNGISEEEWEKL